ncbi:hypothetical protein BGZ94_004509 [Podila epigama]|nr:hypothetical protein BGZ94_004509 [Podila epigama]
MKLTIGSLSALILATLAFVGSTEAAARPCYNTCLKDGGTWEYCASICYNKTCYRNCLKDGVYFKM